MIVEFKKKEVYDEFFRDFRVLLAKYTEDMGDDKAIICLSVLAESVFEEYNNGMYKNYTEFLKKIKEVQDGL